MVETKRVVNIDDCYYEKLTDLYYQLAAVDSALVKFTDGLSIIEKNIMKELDEAYYKATSKNMPEARQRRDAKSHIAYANGVRAKAKATHDQRIVRGKINVMNMYFNEFQTRAANNRKSM